MKRGHFTKVRGAQGTLHYAPPPQQQPKKFQSVLPWPGTAHAEIKNSVLPTNHDAQHGTSDVFTSAIKTGFHYCDSCECRVEPIESDHGQPNKCPGCKQPTRYHPPILQSV